MIGQYAEAPDELSKIGGARLLSRRSVFFDEARGTVRNQMSAPGVRRDKAALSSGCKPHPATAQAGSNRSSYGGNEVAEAFGKRVTNW
jgi:hypothetical protein